VLDISLNSDGERWIELGETGGEISDARRLKPVAEWADSNC
jgi:hypothetical protein